MTALLLAALVATAGPKTPEEERQTFQLPDGYRAELVAAEPNVVDPVACCFDHRGHLFVCEMRGYPNGGVGTGTENRGRVRMLTDADGDGTFETAVTFADGLRFPMGVVPWKTGVIVAVAPDIVFLDDTDGDGKADVRRVLYTGFDLANIQQMVNGLTWQPDGYIYGIAGNPGGTVKSAEVESTPVPLRGRGFRFRPDQPGSLEPTTGGGQYGLTADDFGHWFTATNSQHLRQIAIPDHYLRANPKAAMPAATVDIPEHGAACKVFRVSPFEAWRVERTTRRASGADAKRFVATELVPGGFVTSACSPLFLDGSVYVCDPANNVVIRDTLHENGAIFTARRAYPDREFLASTDNWFRPTHLSVGPDGAMYVLDFYREVIETPLSLPDDIKAKLNLETRERGRIWRITTGERRKAVTFDETTDVAAKLLDVNPWVRLTASRRLIERKAAAEPVLALAAKAKGTPALATVLTLATALGGRDVFAVAASMSDPIPGNREVGLRLAEQSFGTEGAAQVPAARLADDPSPMVRFQLALSAARMPDDLRNEVLARLLSGDGKDQWITSAAISSAGGKPMPLIVTLLKQPATDPVVTRAAIVRAVATVDPKETSAVIGLFAVPTTIPGVRIALFDGVTRMNPAPLPAIYMEAERTIKCDPTALANAQQALLSTFPTLADETKDLDLRQSAARVLGRIPHADSYPALAAVLDARHPPTLQTTAVRSLAELDASKLLPAWPTAGPAARREIAEQLVAKPARAALLLDAVAAGKLKPVELDPSVVARLKATPATKDRATKLFAATDPNRKAVIDKYAGVHTLTGDANRGQLVFKTHCAGCHKLGTDGHDVGPNLLAALGGKSTDDLLAAVLDPNREVDSRYLGYRLNTTDGRTLTGILVNDAVNAVTLRRADGTEDVVRRADVESLRSTGQSLMPEGFEQQVNVQQMADLFAWLRVKR